MWIAIIVLLYIIKSGATLIVCSFYIMWEVIGNFTILGVKGRTKPLYGDLFLANKRYLRRFSDLQVENYCKDFQKRHNIFWNFNLNSL